MFSFAMRKHNSLQNIFYYINFYLINFIQLYIKVINWFYLIYETSNVQIYETFNIHWHFV